MMKAYPSFIAWKRDQTQTAQSLIQKLRKIVADCGLPLVESVKWGNGVWLKGDLPIAYIYGMKDGVQFGFFAGAKIADPKSRLQGKGKFVRSITIHSKNDIDSKYFAALVKKAAKVKYK